MLYLVEPDGSLYQTPVSVGRALVRRNVEKKSLDTLEWQPLPKDDETVNIDDMLDAALRFGIPTWRGLIVDAGFVSTLGAPALLKDARTQWNAVAEQLAQISSDKVSYPDRSSKISQAQHQRNELLNKPINPDLAKHWKKRNGLQSVVISAKLEKEEAEAGV